MAFHKIYTEVTGGPTIEIILLALFVVGYVITSFFLIKKYKPAASPLKLALGISLYFVISAVATDFSLNLFLFPQGDYVNYGLGGGLLRLFSSIFLGFLIGFWITRLSYFKFVTPLSSSS
ncbi:MAG TPA: hypothetical protein VFK44_00330 [Bacillales bacterium]|nr:hypothetical protein [Bacillales bacterium]